MALGDDERGAVGQLRRGPCRHAKRRRGAGGRNLLAIELLLRRGRYEADDGEAQHSEKSQTHHCTPPPTFWLSPGFEARSVLPMGTTLSTTRPFVRYFVATRLTSAAVMARRFW